MVKSAFLLQIIKKSLIMHNINSTAMFTLIFMLSLENNDSDKYIIYKYII